MGDIRKITISGVILIFFFLLAACKSPAATGTDTNNDNQDASASETEEEIVLTMWDHYSGEQGAHFDSIISKFEEQHPNVTIDRTTMDLENLRNTVRPALTSGEGPDLVYYTPGPGYVGVLAEGGLLKELTPYAEEYGWHDKYPEWVMEQGVFHDGLYSIGNEIELIGVYYNKKIFNELGLEVPADYDEFLEINESIKNAGITPIAFGDREQWPAFHLESLFYTAVAGKEEIDKVLNKEAGFDQPVFAESLNELTALIENGYFTENPLSISYDDANRQFFSGNAAMNITGTWLVGEVYENLGEDAGFFMLPPVKEELPHTAPGGFGQTIMMSNSTSNPDEAAAFIDFFYSEGAAQDWYGASTIPPIEVDTDNYDINPLFADVINMATNPNGLSHNLDVLMPQNVNQVTQNILQELIAGQVSSEEVVNAKQEALDQAIEEGNY